MNDLIIRHDNTSRILIISDDYLSLRVLGEEKVFALSTKERLSIITKLVQSLESITRDDEY